MLQVCVRPCDLQEPWEVDVFYHPHFIYEETEFQQVEAIASEAGSEDLDPEWYGTRNGGDISPCPVNFGTTEVS